MLIRNLAKTLIFLVCLKSTLCFALSGQPERLERPERIVALSPVISEWTAEILGKDSALKILVGVSEYSTYPAYLSQIKTVGPYPKIQIEAVAALHPDLVLASENANLPDQIEKLKRLRLNVMVLKAERFSSMEIWVSDLGVILGEKSKGEAAAVRWRTELKALQKKVASRKEAQTALIQIQDDPIFAVGGDSFLTEAFRAVGYENIFSGLSQAYPKVSREAILKADPDMIFILSMGDSEKMKRNWAKFDEMKAVKNKNIRELSDDDFARCSLRLLQGLEKL